MPYNLRFLITGCQQSTNDNRFMFNGIVGKYGAQVQALLKKASGLDIQMICPLYGPVLKEHLDHYINLYHTFPPFLEICQTQPVPSKQP